MPTKSPYSSKRNLQYSEYTPYGVLRAKLKLSGLEWAKKIGIAHNTLRTFEAGHAVPSIWVAKRIQHEAWKLGHPVTLDELYEHVIPFGLAE